jgi:hypothetical protein
MHIWPAEHPLCANGSHGGGGGGGGGVLQTPQSVIPLTLKCWHTWPVAQSELLAQIAKQVPLVEVSVAAMHRSPRSQASGASTGGSTQDWPTVRVPRFG